MLDVVDEYNISCASAHFSSNTSDKTKINYVMKLPKNLPAGNYKLRITTQEFTDFLYEYSFPIYGADTLCCSDIMDTNCESYVEFLHKIGILPGYADGTFKPSQAITYGELIDALAAMSKSSRDVINGYAGSEVAETDAADYNIMLKMILNTLGYTEESSTAYAQRAKELFITNVLGWTGSDNSRGNAAVMLAMALYAEIQEDGTAAKINLLNKNFEAEMDDVRYNSAVAYGDTILKYDRDAYGKTKSAQLIDGINIYTKQPAQYSYGGVTSTISNFTTQQNTLRTLDALSNITGDEKYVNRAKDAVRYTLSNIADSNGTPYMGGHVWWDASREQTAKSKTNQLELKCFFPYYDIWYKTDAALASKAVGAMWDAFMTDWSKALFSRHGSYNKTPTSIWDNNWTDPDPWFKAGFELPFYLTGIDMAVAAYKEQEHTGNAKAGTWAKRIIGMYRKASDPTTHLFPDIFVLSGGSSVRDRGLDQFGVDFPEETYGFKATEGNIQGTYHTTAASIPDVLSLYDARLMDSETFNWYVEDYIGYLEYQYVSSEHKNKYILADGTNLEGYELKRDGYFGKAGNVLKSATISRTLLPNAVGLYLRTNNERFWTFARDIASYYGLGDIGTAPGENVALNLATMVVNPGNVFAMCELYEETGCTEYLKLAKAIANNYILYMKRGFFMTPDERSIILNWKYKKVYANFNDKDAWAILRVKAAMDGTGDLIPDFTNGVGDVTDNFDGFMGGSDPYKRSEVGENCAIFRGEYDIERVMDYNLSGTEITGKQSDEAMITVSGNNINCEMIFSGKVPQSGYKIILALYDAAGSMIDCVMPDTVNEFAINGMRNMTFTVPMTDSQAEKTKSAKCFVWSSQTMYPYTQSDLFVVSE